MNRLCLAEILMATVALAQAVAPSFEVATVKPAAPNQHESGMSVGRGFITAQQYDSQGGDTLGLRPARLPAFRRTEMGGFPKRSTL